jgi:membrane carboxypeptidase/penicillin-binding protein
MQIKVFKDLPDVSKVKDMVFSQATIITDRNGVELYKLFDENREYVDISQMSQHMINAIVAMEDQHFWEHE